MLNFLTNGKQVQINKNIYTIKRLGIGYVFRLFDLLNTATGVQLDLYDNESILNKVNDIVKTKIYTKDLMDYLSIFIEEDVKGDDGKFLLKEVLQFNNPTQKQTQSNNTQKLDKTQIQRDNETNDALVNVVTILTSKLHMDMDYVLENVTLVQAMYLIKSVNLQRIQSIVDRRVAVWADGKDVEKHIATNIKGLKWGNINDVIKEMVEKENG